jgi:hypothetical protein
LRWDLGGLRLEATSCGALRLSRHRSRGLTTGYAIRCHPSTSCGGAYDSVLVGPRLQDVATGGNWGLFYSAPQDFVVLGVFCARFPPREAS